MAQELLEVCFEMNGLPAGMRGRQRAYEAFEYKYETPEEAEEHKQRYAEARLGDATTGDQKNVFDRIYKSICMKRRMRAKALKKQQK